MRLNMALFYLFLLVALAATVLSQETEEQDTKTENTQPATTTKPPETTKPPGTTNSPAPTTGKPEETTVDNSPTSNLPRFSTTTTVRITGTNSASNPTGSMPGVGSNSMPALPTATRGRLGVTPVASVPPTANAPYMQKSNLPEGTVFIAVGSALGLFALSVVSWRCLVAWSLHRSVKHASIHAHHSDSKAVLRPPQNAGSGGFYTGGPGSTLSLDHLGAGTRPPPNLNRQPTPNPSLFFSPTAGGAAADRRTSQYLPSGYYAPGNRDSIAGAAGHPNPPHSHIPSHSVSSNRYTPNPSRGLGATPPGSPSIGPSGPAARLGSSHSSGQQLLGLRGSESHTSLNLPPTGRAPSAYLEDLFENHRQNPSLNNNGRY